MRTKALLLGATPPCVGPWVCIRDAKNWTPLVETWPVGVELNGQVKLDVRSPEGRHFVGVSEVVSGTKVRAIVGEVEGLSSITVYVEAQGGS